MGNKSTAYILKKGAEIHYFRSEKEACAFVGASHSQIAKDYKRGSMCRGYTIQLVGSSSHNESHTRLYKIWGSMKERCSRKAHVHYKNYGGRGIMVCKEWVNSYEEFRNWAHSNGYTDELMLDRINVNGDYEPSNCRWVPKGEQALNRRNSHFVKVNGEVLNASVCARKYGIPLSTVLSRDKHGRDILTGVRPDGKYVRTVRKIRP